MSKPTEKHYWGPKGSGKKEHEYEMVSRLKVPPITDPWTTTAEVLKHIRELPFSLDIILSIIYGRSAPGTTKKEMDQILWFLTGNPYITEVMDFQYDAAIKQSKEILVKQFPLLDTIEAREEYRIMQEDIDNSNYGSEINNLKIKEWRNKQAEKYGEVLLVKSYLIK